MAGLIGVPFLVTAIVRSGVSVSPRYGLTLDGLLAAQMRHEKKRELLGEGASGSDLDGGLDADEPVDWDLPLARCERDTDTGWHWACTGARLLRHDGSPVDSLAAPDTHRLLVRVDDRRAQQVAVRVPADTGGPRGRYRARTTPVLVTPAAALEWRAVGDPDAVALILAHVPAVGARRGSGEGAVTSWQVTVHEDVNPDEWCHTFESGRVGRPIPVSCAARVGATGWVEAVSGLRPPLFHPSRQRMLASPAAAPE